MTRKRRPQSPLLQNDLLACVKTAKEKTRGLFARFRRQAVSTMMKIHIAKKKNRKLSLKNNLRRSRSLFQNRIRKRVAPREMRR